MINNQRITIFHPDFPSSHPLGGAIIECQSGISFRFPLDLLPISTPFADAASISCQRGSNLASDGDQMEEDRIILSNIPVEGFHILLTALHPITPYHTFDQKVSTLATKSVEDILEAYKTADILDIPTPTLSRLLIPCFPDPFVKYALSTATSHLYGSEADNGLIQSTVVETFNSGFDSMPRFAELLLLEFNPSYHVRLRVLLEERKKIPFSIYIAMCELPTPDGIHDFTKQCSKLHCNAMVSVKLREWKQLRERTANDVWAAFKEEPCPVGDRSKVINITPDKGL